MNYSDLPKEFGRWLGRRKGEPFMIFVEPVEGSGATVTVVSDREQFEAAYSAHRTIWAKQSVELYMALEEAGDDSELENPEDE